MPRARPIEVLGGAPLDDGHIYLRQRQLGREHHARRPCSCDHHRALVCQWITRP